MKKIILVIIAVVIIFSIIGISYRTQFDAVFTSEKWDRYPEKRYKLIDSLVQQYEIVGFSRQQVKELLGEKEILMDNPEIMEYFISAGVGDVVGLILFFDQNGIVCEYKISQH